ncbi:MarR family transcriptional regulator [Gulosibacter macacae]|uniref:MarR family transcriptional regulator n=1 Tax=Gulosibacter macacae TaxID=2488791 RepID=A0A3P3W0F5_9MICO|nr:helix-turn-helix domain-containing protein [Gulosibacter macacae]RRJ88264.1 MarR family transcriptional regulator [Gulosibacter macacae]
MPTPPPGMLDRILLILGTFDLDHPARSQVEIVRLTGIPQSSVQRIVRELTATGMLERLDRDQYALGTRLWELGELSPLSLRLREAALPHLVWLYEETGESIHLGVLVGDVPASA